MMVAGETFSFFCERKGAEEVRCHKYPNFQAKGLLPNRTLESFIRKSTDGAIPNHQETPYRVYHNTTISSLLRKNLSGKRTE